MAIKHPCEKTYNQSYTNIIYNVFSLCIRHFEFAPWLKLIIDLVGCRDTVWGVLTGQGTDNLTGLVMHEVKEIETWVLRLLSAPVPVPGKTRVEVILLLMMLALACS